MPKANLSNRLFEFQKHCDQLNAELAELRDLQSKENFRNIFELQDYLSVIAPKAGKLAAYLDGKK
jgi:hypothetical protein